MPPKASGRGRKKVVEEKTAKAAENSIKSYFSPSKSKNETIDSNLLNGKIDTEDEKTEEIIKRQGTKLGRKRGKLDTAEDISDNVERDLVSVTAPKRGRKKLNQDVSKQTESIFKEDSKELVNGEDLDTSNAKKPIESSEEMEDEGLAKESETKIKTKATGKQSKKKLTEDVSEPTESTLKNNSKEQLLAEGDVLDDITTEERENITDKLLADADELNENKPKEKGKRGRKKVVQASNKDLAILNVKKPIENTEEIKNESSDKEVDSNDVKTKDKVKRGRKKNAVLTSDENKTSDSSAMKAESKESKNEEKEVNTSPVKAGRKRKNDNPALPKKETKRNKAAEKNLSDVDAIEDDRILKVALIRSKSIDELVSEESDKIKEKGKDVKKPAPKGKRAKAGETDTSDSNSKPAKKPKEETKSKGQSKKDKMPDVTLLDFDNTSTSPTGKNWNMKLVSWNVNGVRAWLEKDGLIYLKHESPDIMCIQETKCSKDKLPAEVNVDGYHSYWLAGDKDGYSGVGFLSKKKPLSVKYGIDIKEHDTEGRVITAEYDEFFLISAYVPNAGRGLVRLDYRMQWDKDFCSYIKSLDEKKPIILCGDLNVAHEEIDIANPKSNKKSAGFTKEEREGFSTLLSEGFIDTFRHLYPDQKAAYTFWTYMMNARAKNVGWRLDYFVVSKRFTDNLCDSVIRKDVFGSDHCPIALFISV